MGTLFEVNGSTGAVNFRQAGTSNLVLETGASLPVSGVEGKIFWKSDVDTLFVHNGTDFQGVGAGYNRVYTEAPAGAIDGVNTVYTTAFSYVAGTTIVTRDGLTMLRGGVDYTETSPAAGTITFVTAPAVSSVITISYSRIEAAMLPSMQKAAMVTGTPSGNYTGSTTVFDLPFAYTVGNNALLVYSSGVLMRPGAGNDYQETSSSQITFNVARTGGEVIQFIKLGYNDPVGGGWSDSGSVIYPTTATDQVQIGTGSAGTPSLSFISAPTTGLYLTGTGSVRFSSLGTNVFRTHAGGAEIIVGSVMTPDGSAASPSHTFSSDQTTGIYRQAAGVLSITSGGLETHRFGAVTTADATTHILQRSNFGGNSVAAIHTGQTTTGVSTGGSYIGGVSAGLVLVTGNDGANYFVDLVLTSYNSGTALTIAQLTHQGTPSSRTYVSDATGLKLTMGSGTYAIAANQFDMGFR